jgi:Ring hydroxylating beta subunit
MAWAENPPSRTRHQIGNLEAAPLENGEFQAKMGLPRMHDFGNSENVGGGAMAEIWPIALPLSIPACGKKR